MILVYPGSSFKYYKDFPILKETGENLTESGNYAITDFASEIAAYINRFTLEIYATYEVGDNIRIAVDGFEHKNRVAEVDIENKKIKLSKELPFDKELSHFTVKKDFYLYEIDEDCEAGYYRFKNGEVILIRSEFQSIQIDFASLITRNRNILGLFEEADFVDYNREALNSVYGDLSYLKNVWNILDISQFRELIIKKILVLIELNFFKDEQKYIEDYDKYLQKVINVVTLKGEVNETPTSNIGNDIENLSFSVKLGG